MPVQRVVQRHELGADDAPIRDALEEVSAQEHLGGSPDGLQRGGVPVATRVHRQAEHRQQGLHERRGVRVGIPVAVPASVRPLPVKQALDQRRRPLVRDPERHDRVQGVPLLRRATPVAALHDGNASAAVGLGLGPRRELAEVARTEPELEQPVADRIEAFVAARVAEVGEAREDPVQPLPLVVDAPGGPGSTELVPSRKERSHPGGAAYLPPERADRPRLGVLFEDVDPRLPPDRRLRRSEQRVDDRGDLQAGAAANQRRSGSSHLRKRSLAVPSSARTSSSERTRAPSRRTLHEPRAPPS